MFYIKKLLLFTFLMAISTMLFAKEKVVETKDISFMASEGKIYVVMAVVLTILSGLFLFLFRLELKLKKLENNVGSNN